MFKKIYYVNLDHRQDRKEHIENEINKINFNGPVERISAAYGKKLDIELIPTTLFTKEAIEAISNKNEILNTKSMTKGAMGCAISHKWIYEKILTNDEDYVLIIEDDSIITDNFMNNLEKILEKYTEYDILWLGYHEKVDNWKFNILDTELDIPQKIWGTFGYIINKKAAKQLIDIFPITLQIDSEIPKVFPNLKVYAVKENNKLILSDLSQNSTKFGTDIQFDKENSKEIPKNNNKLIIISIVILYISMLIIIYIVVKKYIN